jgi:small subunit ribosomal protein S8
MSKTDPIADYITRIRNATRAKHRKVDIPASSIKKEISRILLEEAYINNFSLIEDGHQGLIRIDLKYDENDNCVIAGLQRVSTPGFRRYVTRRSIPRIYNNLGCSIITTSKGVMTGQNAARLGVGGEVLFYVW